MHKILSQVNKLVSLRWLLSGAEKFRRFTLRSMTKQSSLEIGLWSDSVQSSWMLGFLFGMVSRSYCAYCPGAIYLSSLLDYLGATQISWINELHILL